jgi:hypothetical protein
LIDATVVVSCFLIKAYESENPRVAPEQPEKQTLYVDNEQFNDFWDDLYGEFEMGNYSYPASEILFNVDYNAYKTELSTFDKGEP